MNNHAESQDYMMGLMYEDELDPEMRDTLRARLAKKTRKLYEDTLTRFFRFLFDNLDDHQSIFQENFVLRLGVAAAKDSKATVTKLWDGIWSYLGPFLMMKFMMADEHWSYHKSRKGQIAWRSCHDKLMRKCVFKELNV